MIRIKKLKRNPGIFVKDNSDFEFQKYKEFIEESLLKHSITVQNITYDLLIRLINYLDLSKVVIEKHKPISRYTNTYGIYLKLDFSDESYGKRKNFTYSLLIFEAITLFEKTYVYIPLVNNDYYDSVIKETNIYKVIRQIYPLFIESFMKLCKQKVSMTFGETKELKEQLENKFKVVLR